MKITMVSPIQIRRDHQGIMYTQTARTQITPDLAYPLFSPCLAICSEAKSTRAIGTCHLMADLVGTGLLSSQRPSAEPVKVAKYSHNLRRLTSCTGRRCHFHHAQKAKPILLPTAVRKHMSISPYKPTHSGLISSLLLSPHALGTAAHTTNCDNKHDGSFSLEPYFWLRPF